MNSLPELSCDVLIIGSGAAGLSLALRLAEHSSVIVLSKGPISEGSTFYAQGGIAAVFDETDSIESHIDAVAAHLGREPLVALHLERAPGRVVCRQQCQTLRAVAYRSGRAV